MTNSAKKTISTLESIGFVKTKKKTIISYEIVLKGFRFEYYLRTGRITVVDSLRPKTPIVKFNFTTVEELNKRAYGFLGVSLTKLVDSIKLILKDNPKNKEKLIAKLHGF